MLTRTLLQATKTPNIDPWEFCQRYLPDRVQPGEWGYRARCVKLLASVLEISPDSVERWGSRFERMPRWARRQISYLDRLAVLGDSATRACL